jgi:hypothetical protein
VSKDVKLGAIGTVYKNSKGSIKTKKFGSRNIGKGAEIGAILGVVAAVFPAVTPVGGLVAGAAVADTEYWGIGGGTVSPYERKLLQALSVALELESED